MTTTIYQLVEQPDFSKGSHATRIELFTNWKAQEVQPYVAGLSDVSEQRRITQEVEDYFNALVPAPVEPAFFDMSDTVTAISSSVDVAQALGGKLTIQAASLTGLDEHITNLQGFVDANVVEADDTRKFYSVYVKDKQYEFQELMNAETSDGELVFTTIDFYLSDWGENLDILGLLVLESVGICVIMAAIVIAVGRTLKLRRNKL